MRIAYVSADRGIPVFGAKGASIHIQAMLKAFAAEGHEVRLLCARQGGASPAGLSVEEVPATVQRGADRLEKELAALAHAETIEQRLVQLHADWPFDLVYERYSLWSAAGVRAGRRLGLPVVAEMNAPLVLEQAAFRELCLDETARAIEAEVLEGSAVVAAVSGQVADYARDRGAAAASVAVIGNGVDTALFHRGVAPARLPSIPEGAFVVGFSGSLKLWHGVDTLMEAFRSLRDRVPSAHLLVLGEGPMKGWIEGFADGARLTGAVTLTGWVDHADLPPYLARMDVATAPYPASDDHYFSPLKLFEYLAAGRPVVASRIGQTAELLDGAEAARLVRPGDPEALSDVLAALAADAEARRRMSEAAAAIGAGFDWRNNARRVVELVEGRRRAA